MRIVFIGASLVAQATAEELLKRNHEVVIIEKNKEKINSLAEHLDCGFLNGDGSTPAILHEAGPEHTDLLFCMTNSDQMNIIASLVGRSLGFKKIITKIEDQELNHICKELGLENTIIPTITISRRLTDLAEGRDIHELSSMIRGDARFYSFIFDGADETKVSDLGFPAQAKVICYYRDEELLIAQKNSKLKKGDEVVVLAHSKDIEAVKKQWSPTPAEPQNPARPDNPGDVEGTENIR
ncbi:MAG: TrkA family potassium uptake protein [Desulfurivibrionaceae bacterium]|nr:TrkA family potassium uptake protein [Desulfobulbales bacterium]MDT8334369.1 TrkA family potassium uptake protein [Desulfurivibrionaceae bacterium]